MACIKMVKKWAVQGITEDIDSAFGTNSEAIVQSLREEIEKIFKSEVNGDQQTYRPFNVSF